MIIILLLLAFSIQKESKIIDCKIIYTDNESRIVACPKQGEAKLSISEWPKEWDDSTKVNDIVKMKVSDTEMIPFLSCEAREKLMREKLSKRKTEFKLPLQLPIDKDCQ